jgi:riboflavin kinase / FMN adenylyltransferase
MQIFRHLSDQCCYPAGSVVTIGTFDGLHLGHQALIHETVKTAQARGLSSVVVFFDPHPAEFFAGDNAPARISNFRDKIDLLRHLGVNAVVCLPFDAVLATMEATVFIEKIVAMLNIKHLVMGQDFCFGRNRLGNKTLLETLASQGLFSLHIQDYAQLPSGLRISSTAVREAISRGDFESVRAMLGRRYSLSGRVARGSQLKFSVPTMNIPMPRPMAAQGVFAVRIGGLGPKPLPGVANLGLRPTVDGHTRLLEVHCFDFNEEVYGQHITVHFIAKIREERKFTSSDALAEQIRYDMETAKHLLKLDVKEHVNL